jgi:hypothetical protein
MRISTGNKNKKKQLTELKRSGAETRPQPASAAVAPASTSAVPAFASAAVGVVGSVFAAALTV